MTSVDLDDPDKGLAASVLRDCDVLVWWGHKRQAEVTPEAVRGAVERIREVTLGLVALRSAH